MKRLLALLTALSLLLSPALAAEPAAGLRRSGSLTAAALSKPDISRLLAGNGLGFEGEAMDIDPLLTAPYASGQPSQAARTAAINRFNALRLLAGLPAVSLDTEMNYRAQYGAALLAATGQLDHHPAQPEDMPDFFYQTALNATSSCNIYQGSGATLPQAIDAFFNDSDEGNLPSVGHRRWMLNPSMEKTGLGFVPSGYAYGSTYYNFATLWAFDRSGGYVDYDFIAWPASGYFPNTVFTPGQGWSVTLNPQRFSVPQLADLTVTVKSGYGAGSWTLSGSQTYSAAGNGEYLNVDTVNYGIDNAIIFRPGPVEEYVGPYTVTIQGLRDTQGQAVDFSYQVEFFDPAFPQDVPASAGSQSSAPITDFADVPGGAWYEQAVAYASQRKLLNGVGGGLFDPEGTTTRAMIMTILARLDGTDTTPQGTESWEIRGMRWAVSNQISDGLRPESTITLEELVTMLYRYARLHSDNEVVYAYHLPSLPDGKDVSDWATEAVNWAVDKAILVGDQYQRLNPHNTATRGQTAVLLQRFLNYTQSS